ncbi:hypothetical protein [Providencia burhodogranariea]|nr:hypothetical protein [Providencia burhodogranariea]
MQSNHDGCYGSSVQSLVSMDGYSGIQLAPNVLLVIYNTTLTSTAQRSNNSIQTQIATFDTKGNLSVNTGTQVNGKICYDVRNDSRQTLNMTNVRYTSGNITWGIYVKPGNGSSQLNVPNVLIGKLGDGARWEEHVLSISGNSLVINPPIKCTVAAPPTIEFGKIYLTGNEKDGDILAYNNGNVSLNCSSDEQTATANTTISITGNKGRYTDTLALSGTSASAEIRGIIGSPIPPTGSCSAKGDGYTNFIHFSAPTPIDVGKINVGTNLIPYSFTLCSKGVYALGEATATATMDINWE